jgi:IclR family transcriptional regulator, mhp operon transcriptional activator
MQPKPIRSFARGLGVLSALNRHGSATALTLAHETGLPRATLYRLLLTLLESGYVGRGTVVPKIGNIPSDMRELKVA